MDISECSTKCMSPCEAHSSQSTRVPRSPARLRRRSTGYDCEFVDPAPTLIQTECAICLLLLKEPYLIGCCGHNYCRVCIDAVKNQGRPCPLCGAEEYGVLPNKGLERSMNELKVECSKKTQGCGWSGPLNQYLGHLNESYDSSTQLTGCSYVEVECVHGCGARFPRHSIAEHQTNRCPQRPFCCDYCRDYNSIQADVVFRHWPVCPSYPMTCPNRCTVYAIERQFMTDHLDNDCPLRVIDCDLQHAGCEVQLPRKDMPGHLSEACVQHTSLLSALNQKLLEDLSVKDDEFTKYCDETSTRLSSNKTEIDQLRTENTLLKFTMAEMRAEMGKMFETMKQSIAELQTQPQIQEEKLKRQSESSQSNLTSLENKLGEVRSDLSSRCHLIQAQLGMFPVVFTLSDYSGLRGRGEEWVSPTFRDTHNGYHMCLVVDCSGDCVSVYTCLVRGAGDDSLPWPFTGEVTVQLLNQLGDRHHATGSIRFTQFTPTAYSSRVSGSGHGAKGWGQQRFISHQELSYNDVKKRQYLMADKLLFRIVKFESFKKN